MTETGKFKDRVFSNLCQGIDELYSDGQLCDLVVNVGDAQFSCHRLVMGAASGFFRSSLTSFWLESSSGVVSIDHEDVTKTSFHLLLDILYKGEDVVTKETVNDILRMSIFLQVKFLEEYCIQFLCDSLSPKNCLHIWQFAEKYQLTTLAYKAVTLAASSLNEVAKCEEFCCLPKEMFLILLSVQKYSKFKVISVDELCQIILFWAQANIDSRKVHLGELLPFVNFAQVSPQYLTTLARYWDHPFRKYIFKFIEESLDYNLKGLQGRDWKVQQQIVAQQDVYVSVPNMYKAFRMMECAVLVGGCTENVKECTNVTAIPINVKGHYKVHNLKPLPESCGLGFATCVWRNELYVSGGSSNKTFFAVYSPGNNEWEKLTVLPRGLEMHSMVAIDWKIYVLGGMDKALAAQNIPVTDIWVFNITTKAWRNFSHLLIAVFNASATTLGHRIYVFGGLQAGGVALDNVQCVDSMTGCVYLAGHLPSPTYGARALSNGGTVFVITSEGNVLQMKENFALAGIREKELSGIPEAKLKKTRGKSAKPSRAIRKLPVEDEDVKPSTVQFQLVNSFASRKEFGAYLRKKEVVVCGGRSEEGVLLHDMVGLRLNSTPPTFKTRRLSEGLASFCLQVLNMPLEFLTDVIGRTFRSKGCQLSRVYCKDNCTNIVDATVQKFCVGDKVMLTPTGVCTFFKDLRLGLVTQVPPKQNTCTIMAIKEDGRLSVDFGTRDGILDVLASEVELTESV